MGYGSGFAGEAITVSTTAVGPTTATAKLGDARAATAALVTVETNSIRFRYDGTNPTAAVGHVAAAGSSFRVEGAGNVSRLKMIRVSADAVVHVTYER